MRDSPVFDGIVAFAFSLSYDQSQTDESKTDRWATGRIRARIEAVGTKETSHGVMGVMIPGVEGKLGRRAAVACKLEA
ncbi:MAG: hypothetical protein JSV16_15510 [Candidatus Hydrogenedentota bacterium]|nr:MAG: hypothetical protein JSV16_15510 [Candidatus Hydrogenedentota bacterium]